MKKIIFLCLTAICLFGDNVYATFDVEANKKADLSLDTAGTIEKIYVDVGSIVKKDEILLELKNQKQQISTKLANINLNKSKIAYEHAKATLTRYKNLKDVIDKEKIDNLEFDYNIKYEDYQNAQNSLSLAEIQFNETILKAPFSGVISKKNYEMGDGIDPRKAIFELVDTSSVKLILEFDEKYWMKVKVGQKFTYKVDGDPTNKEAQIVKVYPTINPKNRKIKAEVMANDLIPGLFGDGYINID